ncbi:histidinol dehydrogenase [Luteitalea sp. TBR-22]|uniref:histidinol dehydrogenase n=1 Tax=Luteitalea sp. TBR-22 TaxID=2802971 RepID=UPI001AFB3479|nr:histidinol dehydrogenase [Luteitalea sp. TBR-22]
MLPILASTDAKALRRLLDRTPDDHGRLEPAVKDILAAVRTRGDKALTEFARRFDKLEGPIELSPAEIHAGAAECPPAVRAAIRKAARHIKAVAKAQVPATWTKVVAPGVKVSQRVLPLERVGCYVPGGRYPLPSSLLMAAVTARAAGVPEVIVCCPRPDAAVLAAAVEAGVDRVFQLGGAHAIAAMAYGTATVPRVDKIVGPGNAYVALAKALVARDCAIDFFAGPSEIVVVAATGDPAWIAADLLAQAEHDVDARAIFLTPSKRLATQVAKAIERQLATPEAAATPAAQALARNGAIVVTKNVAEAAALANRIAPEHLVVDTPEMAAMIPVAASIFIGPWTAQAAGDYAIGSNHVLPTSGAARFRGGLHAWDFVRVSSVQQLTKAGAALVGPTAATLADAEGLKLHAASIRARLGIAPKTGRRAR